MNCPLCKNRLKVLDTRPTEYGVVYRKFHCKECDRIYRSVECIDNSEETKQEYLATKMDIYYKNLAKQLLG